MIYFDKSRVFSSQYGPITFVPVSRKSSSFMAGGRYGNISLKESRHDDFVMYDFAISLKKPIELITIPKGVSLVLPMRGDLNYSTEGLPVGKLSALHFNMFCLAGKETVYTLNAETYQFFGVCFNIDFLEKWGSIRRFMDAFLDQVVKRRPAMISNHSLLASDEMIGIVNGLRGSKKLVDLYRYSKVIELLRLATVEWNVFEKNVPGRRELNNRISKQKVLRAREYIMLNIQHPGTLEEIAERVGLRDFKLKTGFKALFGMTVFDFIYSERMKKAHELLQSGKCSSEIFGAVGYLNLSNFSAAFKHYFGYNPSSIMPHPRYERFLGNIAEAGFKRRNV